MYVNKRVSLKTNKFTLDMVGCTLTSFGQVFRLSLGSAATLLITSILKERAPSAMVIPVQDRRTGRSPKSYNSQKHSEFAYLRRLCDIWEIDPHIKSKTTDKATSNQLGRQFFRNVVARIIVSLGLERTCSCGQLIDAMRGSDKPLVMKSNGYCQHKGRLHVTFSQCVDIWEGRPVQLSETFDEYVEMDLKQIKKFPPVPEDLVVQIELSDAEYSMCDW